jgi:hypothetical protein
MCNGALDEPRHRHSLAFSLPIEPRFVVGIDRDYRANHLTTHDIKPQK